MKTTYSYINGSLATVAYTTNDLDGAAVAHYEYDAFGNTIVSNGTKAANLLSALNQLLIGNLDNILIQLPILKKQAHDRIIGGRRIKQDEKILSVYEPNC